MHGRHRKFREVGEVGLQDTTTGFDLSRMRAARLRVGMTLKEVAFCMGLSASQVHRVESGTTKLTLSFLDSYCRAIGWHALDVIDGEVRIPLVGLVGDDSLIRPLGLSDQTHVRTPRLVRNPQSLHAVRFSGYSNFRLMKGHVAYFSAAHRGVPEEVWGARSVLRLTNSRVWMGWPIRHHGQIHIRDFENIVDMNVEIEWAAPLIAVVSPELVS